MEYNLKGGAKVSNLAVWPLKGKDHGNLRTPEKQEFVFVMSRTGSCDGELDSVVNLFKNTLRPSLSVSDALLSPFSFPRPRPADRANQRPHPVPTPDEEPNSFQRHSEFVVISG